MRKARRARGPSLNFHERAIERRRAHESVGSLLGDERFLECVYAVLPAAGMHRMSPPAANVGNFEQITAALQQMAATAWGVIERVRVSTSGTQIVAGSKFLHHLLPNLLPPIDRQYTFRFFTGQKAVRSDRLAFQDGFPRLAEVGVRCRGPIREAVARGGFMAIGEANVIDNAIFGFVQQRQR